MTSENSFSCPVCGGPVPLKAKACPHCGACEKSGWNREATGADGLDLPDEDFDYDKFSAEEFGTPRQSRRKERLWKAVSAVILILMIIVFAANYLFRW